MPVFQRPFFNLAVIRVALPDLLENFSKIQTLPVQAEKVRLAFPVQPYHVGSDDLPMILWSPACDAGLTAFMPATNAGSYFILQYATKQFHWPAVSARSTAHNVDWPINEFVAYEAPDARRIVRAMKDSPRWDFFVDGEPLPFEEHDQYTARFIRDRFQRDGVLRYLERWGAPVRQPDFWKSHLDAFSFVRRAL